MNQQVKNRPLVMVPLVGLLTIGLSVYASMTGVDGPKVLTLYFNPYALLSFFAVLINSILFVIIGRSKNKNEATLWYLLCLASLIIWGLTEGMQRLSLYPEAAMYWAGLSSVGIAIMPVAFFMFSLNFVNKSSFNKQSLTWVIIMVSAVMVAYFNGRADIFTLRTLDQHLVGAWGYYWPNAPLFWLYVLWIESFLISSLVILIGHYRSRLTDTKRKQTRLFIISLIISLTLGTITDGLLPLFEIYLIPMAVLFTSIMALMIGYGIHKYGLFRLNPATIADNILSNMSEGVIVTDEHFNIQTINTGTEKLTGLTQQDIFGTNITKLFTDDSTDALQINSSSETLLTKVPEAYLQTANKTKLPVSMSISKVVVDKSTVGYIFVFTDISYLKQKQYELETAKTTIEQKVKDRTAELRGSQARLESSINSLNTGFIMVDAHQHLLTINAAAKSILIEASSELSNFTREWTMATIHETSKGLLNLSHNIRQVMDSREEFSALDVSVGQKIINLHIKPVTDSVKIIGCLVVLEDVTEAKVLERSKDEFFSIASHELRTPLTAIRGNASILQDYFKDKINDEQAEGMIDDIHSSSVRLIGIVNDFLELSRTEHGKIEFTLTEFNVHELVEEVLNELKELASAKGLYLRLDTGSLKTAMVKADYQRCKQVILNMVSNSIKFTEKGGVSVDISSSESTVSIRVKDTGRGIAKPQQSLLFRKFQQAGESILTRDTSKGTGLGLYISRLLTEGMNGSLSIESSKPNKGSVFLLKLPKCEAGTITDNNLDAR